MAEWKGNRRIVTWGWISQSKIYCTYYTTYCTTNYTTYYTTYYTTNYTISLYDKPHYILHYRNVLIHSPTLQRRLHLDQPVGSRGRTGRERERSPGSSTSRHEHGPRRTPPHRRRSGCGRSGRRPHQLERRETTDAPQRRLLSRPVGPDLRSL